MAIVLKLTDRELENTQGSGGIEIHIEGVEGSPVADETLFIEKYEGKTRVVIWNGEQNPTIIELKPKVSRCPNCDRHLSERNSVGRMYINKDVEGTSAMVHGHYDENGDFEPDSGSLPEGRFDLGDNSDHCENCGEDL